MNLESFVKETLLQIYHDVENANNELEDVRKKSDGTALPKMFLISPGADEQQGSGVFFDVACCGKK